MGRANAPAGWSHTYDIIKTMRAAHTAPVDTMGCHMLADDDASPEVCRDG